MSLRWTGLISSFAFSREPLSFRPFSKNLLRTTRTIMNVVVENLPNCITTLRIELEADKVNKVWDAVTGDYTKYAKIPGYRAGKAPKSVIEKKFKKQIREELEKKLLSDSCREAISEKKLRVLSLAQIDDVELYLCEAAHVEARVRQFRNGLADDHWQLRL